VGGELGGQERDRELRPAADVQDGGHLVEHLGVREHVGAADLNLAIYLLLASFREVLEDIVGCNGLGAVAQPGGRDHRWQSFHEVLDDAVGLAAGADDHRGAEVGERRAFFLEDLCGHGPALQVLRFRLVAKAAEIDDPFDALLLGHARKVLGRFSFALHEALAIAAAAHRVDEVVGDVHAVAGSLERVGVEDVALVEVEAFRRLALVPDEPAHVMTAFAQQVGEVAADEPGDATDERAHVRGTYPG
jgi:hypothetical protein